MSTALLDDITARLGDRLIETFGESTYELWFADVRMRLEDNVLVIAAPHRYAADRIARRFTDNLAAMAGQELDQPIEVRVEVDPGAPATGQAARPSRDADYPAAAPAAKPAAAPRPARQTAAGAGRAGATRLQHDLDSFVVGPCNQLAYGMARRLVEAQHGPLNRLFVHGGCGLGKTHLLQGLCRRFAQQHPDRRWRYTTAEQFTNEYIQAVRSNRLPEFRKTLRHVDLLAVDDVHFFSDKVATQGEFLHTFDSIEMHHARVVLASDAHPKQIRQISEALTSRFVSGMVVQIDAPDPETRRRLVSALAARRGMMLAESVVPVLAERSNGSVREIEGMLNTLRALADLEAQQSGATPSPVIGHALVQRLLGASGTMRPSRPVRFATILKQVCDALNVEARHVMGPRRHKDVVLARTLVIYLARKMTTMSFPDLARQLNRTSHSTIVTAHRRAEKQLLNPHEQVTGLDGRPTSMEQVVEQLRQRILAAT